MSGGAAPGWVLSFALGLVFGSVQAQTQTDTAQLTIVKNYIRQPNGRLVVQYSLTIGADGLWTTPTDLARYIVETQLACLGKFSRLLMPDSAANPGAFQREKFTKLDELPNGQISPLFDATVRAVEEAVINAMVAAETMEGKAYRLPHESVRKLLKQDNRLLPRK